MITAEDRDIVQSVNGYTLTPKVRRYALIDLLRQVDRNGIEGDVVECGVWRGGNIAIARQVSPQRTCWLYDTFTGMTEPGPEDKRRSGSLASETYHLRKETNSPWCASSLDETVAALRFLHVYDEDKLKFVVGDVLQTLLVEDNLPKKIALLRLDTDWYKSTKLELEVLYPLVSPGGVLIVDDFSHWAGSGKAVNEYFDPGFEMEHIDYSAIKHTKTAK